MSVVRLWVRRNNVDEVPTPVDPAHIQPGDVFCVTYEATCKRVTKSGIVFGTNGYAFDPRDDDGATWFLVHRPDPDAEAIEAIDVATAREGDHSKTKREWAADTLAALRERGWDVVRRAES